MKYIKIVHTIFASILNIFFPISCFGCNRDGVYLCETCFTALPKTDARALNLFFSVFQYKEQAIRDMVWSLKYKGNKDVARLLAGYMYERIYEELSDEALFEDFINPFIVPIPLSQRRLRERGFNQAELLAQEFADNDDSFTLLTNVLYKTKDTRSQTALRNRAERMENVVDSFGVNDAERIKAPRHLTAFRHLRLILAPRLGNEKVKLSHFSRSTSLIKNKNIILIDDIYTTGATLNEAKKVLINAGARRVLCCTIAH